MINNQTLESDENQILLAARMVREYYYPNRETQSADWILILALREMLVSRPDASPEDLFEQLVTQSKIKLRGQLSRYVAQSFTSALPSIGIDKANPMESSIFNGGRRFSLVKLSSMASFFAGKAKHVSKAKLNLLLFYADFANYFSYGHSISGGRYVRQRTAAALYQYDSILKALEYSGIVRMKNRRIENIASDRQVFDNVSFLELITLHGVLTNFGEMTTSEMVEYARKDSVYRFTRLDDFIAYEYARLLKQLPEKIIWGS